MGDPALWRGKYPLNLCFAKPRKANAVVPRQLETLKKPPVVSLRATPERLNRLRQKAAIVVNGGMEVDFLDFIRGVNLNRPRLRKYL